MPNIRLICAGRGDMVAYAQEMPEYRGTVMVRVDDDSRPEFWVEIYLTERDLHQMLNLARTDVVRID